LGLKEEEFTRLREKIEIKQIFEKVGIQYKLGKFESIYIRA
jgi:hypothetical protein